MNYASELNLRRNLRFWEVFFNVKEEETAAKRTSLLPHVYILYLSVNTDHRSFHTNFTDRKMVRE